MKLEIKRSDNRKKIENKHTIKKTETEDINVSLRESQETFFPSIFTASIYFLNLFNIFIILIWQE